MWANLAFFPEQNYRQSGDHNVDRHDKIKYDIIAAEVFLKDYYSLINHKEVTSQHQDDVDDTEKRPRTIHGYLEYSHAEYVIEPKDRPDCFLQGFYFVYHSGPE